MVQRLQVQEKRDAYTERQLRQREEARKVRGGGMMSGLDTWGGVG